MLRKPKIGIIGHTGMVGSEVWNYFKKRHYETYGYSLDNKDGIPNSSWTEINDKCEVLFICVPTPFNFHKKKTDLDIVKSVVSRISPGKIVIIKSTVWPGTTSSLQDKYPKLKLLFNPEFLSRSTACEDFEFPDRQLVGYTQRSKRIANQILRILPCSPYSKTMKAEEAELVKYSHNVWGAIRIIWANHLYEISQKIGADYETIRNGFAASKFIGKGALRYMTIFHNEKRGYGGPCFPKDVASYIEFCKKKGIDCELVKAARDENIRILASQKMTERIAEKF